MIGVILDRLTVAGVSLFVEGGRLRFRSIDGAYTAELRSLVAPLKAAITEFLAQPLPSDHASWPLAWREALAERAAIHEFDGGMTRADAETAASLSVRAIYARAPHDVRDRMKDGADPPGATGDAESATKPTTEFVRKSGGSTQ